MRDSLMISRKLIEYCGFCDEAVVLCIGSDRITGDCLGPVSGQLLTRYYNVPAYVYGSLENPVTALNITAVVAGIKKRHRGCKIIAVDSCVGASGDIGYIRVMHGGIRPGSADGKNLPEIGDISITAVTSDQAPSSSAFASVRLGFIYELSKTIAKGIDMFFSEKKYSYTNISDKLALSSNYIFARQTESKKAIAKKV